MIIKKIMIKASEEFHARPSSQIASAARKFESIIMIMAGVDAADVKNPMALMRLGHPKESEIELMTDGPDEEAAMEEMSSTIRKILENDKID